MVLVAVVAAQVCQLALLADAYFIDKADAEALAAEASRTSLASLTSRTSCASYARYASQASRASCTSAGLDESVLSEDFLLFLFLLSLFLEFYYDTRAGQEILVLGEAKQDGTAFGPCAAVGGTRVPREGEVVAAG